MVDIILRKVQYLSHPLTAYDKNNYMISLALCISYCGRFLSTHLDCVVLAAGTVFNQVVLWSPQVAVVTGDNRAKPFHRLTGHQVQQAYPSL